MYNIILPPTIPQVLTEQIFINCGMFTGTATNYQIQAAFAIAENQVAREIGTYLYPTQVNNVQIPFISFEEKIQLPVGKLITIDSVVFTQVYNNTITRYISGTAHIYDAEKGYVYFQPSPYDVSQCEGCGNHLFGITNIEISLTAGYPSGVVSGNQLAHLALSMAADIVLKQMYDEGIGVYFENQTRTLQIGRVIQTNNTDGFFGNTIFGPSSRGQFIKNLLEPFRINRMGKMGISIK